MDWAPVGVLVGLREQLVLVQAPVLIVDCVIEGDDDHLGKKVF